jgi:hypothetical protein
MTDRIAVTFCSRGRPRSLQQSVDSLYGLADDPDNMEVRVAVDPDDPTVGRSISLLAGLQMPGVHLWTAPERYGYRGLHRYLNALAQQASPEARWLMWWNDDARMRTQGWDSIIRAQEGEAVLWPHANHVQHANLFPIWPKRWSDHTGLVTPTMHMDTWLQYVGESLGRHVQIPVEVFHDRADVTGNHDDATYAEGRKPMGPEGMAPDFQEILQMQFPGYVAKIREIL